MIRLLARRPRAWHAKLRRTTSDAHRESEPLHRGGSARLLVIKNAPMHFCGSGAA